MSAFRWLAHGDWSGAALTGTQVVDGGLVLAAGGGAQRSRHGFAMLRAGRPDPAQVDAASADRWRRVALRLAAPVPPGAWLRLWTRIEVGAAVPGTPEAATAVPEDAPPETPAGAWRAAPAGALDARVLCRADGDLWVAVELAGLGTGSATVADVLVATGDDGPVTALPAAYRETGARPADAGAVVVDDGDGALGRYLGLLGAQLGRTAAVLDDLPALLSPAVAPDRPDAPWLGRLADWVALDAARLPDDGRARRESVSTAVRRHGWRGTRRGLVDQVRRETGLVVEVIEPLQDAAVWRLDGRDATSALGLTTGLVAADPGPPALDSTAVLDGSALVTPELAGLPVHGHVAHRICVHVPGGSADDLAAVDAVVQRERPAHVLARTCAVARATAIPTEVEVDALPDTGPPGLPNDTAHRTDVDGPGIRLGTARLPAAPDEPAPEGVPR